MKAAAKPEIPYYMTAQGIFSEGFRQGVEGVEYGRRDRRFGKPEDGRCPPLPKGKEHAPYRDGYAIGREVARRKGWTFPIDVEVDREAEFARDREAASICQAEWEARKDSY